jgi:hypothetical protein
VARAVGTGGGDRHSSSFAPRCEPATAMHSPTIFVRQPPCNSAELGAQHPEAPDADLGHPAVAVWAIADRCSGPRPAIASATSLDHTGRRISAIDWHAHDHAGPATPAIAYRARPKTVREWPGR